MHKVLIQESDYRRCREAIDRAFAIFPVNLKGKKVLIKPNGLRASEADQGVVTHPAVLRAVVEKVEEFGAGQIVVGDNPGMMSYGSNEKTFRQSGMMEAAKGHYVNIGTEAVEVDFDPQFVDKVSVSRAILDADVLISVPKFKTHGLTIISGAIKNSYGFLPGAQKANLHRLSGNSLRFSELMVQVFKLRVPDLIIVDAVVGMEGNGPASPDLREVGQILASDNAVAIDATIARMMGVEPTEVPFFEIARLSGLGDYDMAAIEVIGDLVPIPDFKLPASVRNAREVTTGEGDFFLSRIQLRPKADKETCTSCGICVDQCPVSALFMHENIPAVDAETCIACFCCQEMCPEMAMRLS